MYILNFSYFVVKMSDVNAESIHWLQFDLGRNGKVNVAYEITFQNEQPIRTTLKLEALDTLCVYDPNNQYSENTHSKDYLKFVRENNQYTLIRVDKYLKVVFDSEDWGSALSWDAYEEDESPTINLDASQVAGLKFSMDASLQKVITEQYAYLKAEKDKEIYNIYNTLPLSRSSNASVASWETLGHMIDSEDNKTVDGGINDENTVINFIHRVACQSPSILREILEKLSRAFYIRNCNVFVCMEALNNREVYAIYLEALHVGEAEGVSVDRFLSILCDYSINYGFRCLAPSEDTFLMALKTVGIGTKIAVNEFFNKLCKTNIFEAFTSTITRCKAMLEILRLGQEDGVSITEFWEIFSSNHNLERIYEKTDCGFEILWRAMKIGQSEGISISKVKKTLSFELKNNDGFSPELCEIMLHVLKEGGASQADFQDLFDVVSQRNLILLGYIVDYTEPEPKKEVVFRENKQCFYSSSSEEKNNSSSQYVPTSISTPGFGQQET